MASAAGRANAGPISHVVYIIQRDRSFNNLFLGFPGASTQNYGYDTLGTKIPLHAQSIATNWDIDHSSTAFFSHWLTFQEPGPSAPGIFSARWAGPAKDFNGAMARIERLLQEPYLSADPNHEGILLHSVYHRPNGWDFIPPGAKIPCGESSMWGDYHLLEALLLVARMADGRYCTFF